MKRLCLTGCAPCEELLIGAPFLLLGNHFLLRVKEACQALGSYLLACQVLLLHHMS